LEAFLLGQIAFDQAVELQRRLVEECRDRGNGQITLLLCEHPAVITVGRGGTPTQVATQNPLIRNRQIEVTWANRGGGCLMHCPGQLAIYPIVPLRWHGFSIGEYLQRLQTSVFQALHDLNVHSCRFWEETPSKRLGIWGRTGQLAAFGVAVRHWITYYGAYLNVCPPTGLFRLVQSDPKDQTPMSSLAAERCGSVCMPTVRAALVQRLAENLGCDRYHLYTGHPMLRKTATRLA
jgi:lipoyl(octanoyl) transferase